MPFCGDTVGSLVRSAVGFTSLSPFLRVLSVGQAVSFPYCAVGQSVYVYPHGAVGWAACLSFSGCCQLVSSSLFLRVPSVGQFVCLPHVDVGLSVYVGSSRYCGLVSLLFFLNVL